MNTKTLWWADSALRLVDQTKLPLELAVIECKTDQDVARAIREMRVRGAPAIGVAAAYGIALGAIASKAATKPELLDDLARTSALLRATRPTAVNLFWAIERMSLVAQGTEGDIGVLQQTLLAEAHRMAEEDEQANRRMGAFGAALIQDGDTVLTHCNAGALATVAYGTALGVVRAAYGQGKRIRVFVDETRPLLQGTRLTAWELVQEGIPTTVITDSMAGQFIYRGQISLVIVGADRIAANGDLANKIGTYSLAVLARENGVPFYCAAPISTIDLSLDSGEAIPIEERQPEEVLYFGGVRIAPEGVEAANPAFDVTPHRYVSAIITERGVVRPPYETNLRRVVTGGGGQ